MMVLSDVQPSTHITDLEMFSFEGRCPGGVPAHPGGHPCGWNGRFEGTVLESQLTPSQEGTVHHLYQEGRIAWRQHVCD